MDIHLQSFGARLRVKDGLFEVTVPDLSGANHHMVEQFATHQVQSILLQPGTSVSADALLLAIEKDTDILVLDRFGHPHGRIWTARPSTTLEVWKNQLAMSLTPDALGHAKSWIETKLHERILFLQKLKNYRSGEKRTLIEKATAELSDLRSRLHAVPLKNVDQAAATMRGLEGVSGRIYLDTLSQLLPDEYRFEGRSRRPAADMFNAFLNYGYGILNRIVERALLVAGLHPYIGFMHYDGYQRKSMVFDFIEPYRIWVEKTVFKLFTAKIPSQQHVAPAPGRTDGLWLNKDGIKLLSDAFHRKLHRKKKELDGKRFLLDRLLTEEARRFSSVVRGWAALASAATTAAIA
jgi:CRISPR-associated protein Cas1